MRRGSYAGFTLIELLIVVVIIGVLAAIAIPKFANTKEKAYLATMKGDLRNLATSQEAYFYDHAVYYSGSIPGAGFLFRPSRGVDVQLANVDPQGWGATATHTSTTRACDMYVGTGGPLAIATIEGEVACD